MMDTTVTSLSTPTLLAAPHLDSETPDAYLLGEFVTDQDEAAFAELVKRHGGLVRGVCRRILFDSAATDDAFQQTFLSLSQHAPLLLRTVAPTASLGSWLYRVAVNASLQLKRKTRSRRRTETQFAEHHPQAISPQEPWNEVLPALDEEISALPGQYRSAVVKCHLEGKTQQDAAKELGITYATLRRRLKEARGLLRRRLSERGFVHNGFWLVPLLGQLFTSDPVSAQTASTITQSVLASSSVPVTAAGTATAAGASATSGAFAWGAKLLALNPLIKLGLAFALTFGIAGSWWIGHSSSSPAEPSQESAVLSEAQPEPEAKPNSPIKSGVHDPFLKDQFAYIFQNGQLLSPEFENAVKALDDSDGTRGRGRETDELLLPELKNSREILKNVSLQAPLPKSTDLLGQMQSSMLSEPGVLNWQLAGPNEKLLDPKVQADRDPLPVEQAMEILNAQHKQQVQANFGHAVPAAGQFFGHPDSQPAKTLKVIPLH